MYSCTTHIININQAGVGYYLHREGPNLGKNIVSLVSCYHPTLTHSSGPPTRDPPVLTPTIGFQYISLHVSTISRLLVISVITSETRNNLRYIKTYQLIV